MARLMGVEVSIPLWQDLSTEGYEIGGDGRMLKCTRGLPEGAELVNSYYDGQRQTAVLIFHHPSFDEVARGDIIPRTHIEFSIVEIGVE